MTKISALLFCVFLAAAAVTASAQTKSALQKNAKITMAEARKTALEKEPGEIKSAELEKEKGRIIYSFDIKTAKGIHEVNVDAVTGHVVEDSVESAQAEAREAAHDRNAAKKPSKGANPPEHQ